MCTGKQGENKKIMTTQHCVTYYKYDSQDDKSQTPTTKITIECKQYKTLIRLIEEIEKVLDEED